MMVGIVEISGIGHIGLFIAALLFNGILCLLFLAGLYDLRDAIQAEIKAGRALAEADRAQVGRQASP